MKRPIQVYILLFLLLFLGIGAIYGGSYFVKDPSGNLIGISVDDLKYSPFTDYFIPGLFLLTILGILPIVIAIGLITKLNTKLGTLFSFNKKYYWSWNFSIYVGIILSLFEIIQVTMLRNIHYLHVIYFILGIIITVVSSMKIVKKNYLIKK